MPVCRSLSPTSDAMNRWTMLAMIGALGACGARQSFDFVLKDGDSTIRVASSDEATGDLTNAGFFTLDDGSWGLTMNLLGLANGNHDISMTSGELQVHRKDTGETFKTSLGGTCSVWLDPHGSRNGSVVTGHFDCLALTSVSGKKVDITNGSFQVTLNDPANNPRGK